MKKKILYFVIPLFLFFSGISTVFADNCSTVKSKIDNYQSYKATVEAEIQEAKEEAIKNMTAFAVPQVETRQPRTNEQQLEIGE